MCVRFLVSLTSLLLATNAGAGAGSSPSSVLVLIDKSGSVQRPGIDEYRLAPIREVQALVEQGGGQVRVWIGLFDDLLYFVDPRKLSSRQPLTRIPEDLMPPREELRPDDVGTRAGELRSAFRSSFRGGFLEQVAITNTEQLAAVERFLRGDGESTWVPSGSTNLVNAVLFATEFATVEEGVSIGLFTDAQHNLPGWLRGKTPAGYAVFTGESGARQFDVFSDRNRNAETLMEAALGHASERLQRANREQRFAEFVVWKWDEGSYTPTRVVAAPPKYYVRAYPPTPQLILEVAETGELVSGIRPDRMIAEWSVPFSLVAYARPGLPPRSIPVIVEEFRVDRRLLEQNDPDRFEALRNVTIRYSGADPVLLQAGGNGDLAPARQLENPTIEGVGNVRSARALMGGDLAFELSLRLLHDGAGPRGADLEDIPVTWANAGAGPDTLSMRGKIKLIERPCVEFATEPSQAAPLLLPRGSYGVVFDVPVRWNAKADGKSIALKVEGAAPEYKAAAEKVEVAFLSDDFRSQEGEKVPERRRAPWEESEPDKKLVSPHSDSEGRFKRIPIVLRSTEALGAVPIPLNLSLTWRDGSPIRTDSRFGLRLKLPLEVIAPEGRADVELKKEEAAVLSTEGMARVATLSVVAKDDGVGEALIEVQVGHDAGIEVEVHSAGETLRPVRSDGNTEAFQVQVPRTGLKLEIFARALVIKEGPAQLGVAWKPVDPAIAELDTGQEKIELTVRAPVLSLEVDGDFGRPGGVPFVSLGDDLRVGQVLDLPLRVQLGGMEAVKPGLADPADWGYLELRLTRGRNLMSARIVGADGRSVEKLSLAQVPRDGLPIRLVVGGGDTRPWFDTRVAGELQVDVTGPLGAATKPLDLLVGGRLPGRVPDSALYSAIGVLVVLLGLGIVWSARSRSPWVTMHGAGGRPRSFADDDQVVDLETSGDRAILEGPTPGELEDVATEPSIEPETALSENDSTSAQSVSGLSVAADHSKATEADEEEEGGQGLQEPSWKCQLDGDFAEATAGEASDDEQGTSRTWQESDDTEELI